MLPSIRILSTSPQQGQMLQSITIQNIISQGQMFFGRNSPISNSGSLFSSVNTTFGQTPIVFERRCFFGLLLPFSFPSFPASIVVSAFPVSCLSFILFFSAFNDFFIFLSFLCLFCPPPPKTTKMTKITTFARYEYSQSSHNRGRHSG